MSEDALRRRLQRMGRGRRKPQVRKPTPSTRQGLPPGEEVETPYGSTFLIEDRYPLDYRHGVEALARLLEFEGTLAAEVVRQPGLEGVPLQSMVFLDTETTGLVGGAGTIAFLVGVGTFTEDTFRLRQYFLRDPGEESSLLHALQEDLEAAAGFVSFNGRAFDVPLLEMRYMLGLRRNWPLTSFPQLDLLHPARRLWRYSLPDCRLGTLERTLLGVRRTADDVPGELIPGMYLDYLRSGDASDMKRVVYHNAVDILSLVGLAVHVLGRHREEDLSSLSGPEALAVARWHQDAGRIEPAEAAYLAAVNSGEVEVKIETLRRYTAHLKRNGRRQEATEHWQTWHTLAPHDPAPCIELAKYYEWHAHDLTEAQSWAKEALLCLTHWPEDWRRDQLWSEIEHRLARLVRKIGA